jgi:hypothetical protein
MAPDFEDRCNGACRRIAFYYPEALEPLVLKQLAVPTYDVFKINDFVRDELYPNKLPEKRRAMFDEFLRLNGPAFSDGVLLELFGDLDLQEADEQDRLSGPLKGKYDARALLVQLFGFPDAVSSTNKPYVTTWEASEEARFIKALGHYKSRKIDAAVHGLFAKITDDDYLALACMDRLIGQGYDEEIRRYCERRIPNSKHFAGELQKVLTQLDSRKNKTTQPDGAANGSQPIRSGTNGVSPPADLVDIGYISASLDEEQSMREVLWKNGIQVHLDGSVAYSILVPRQLASKAVSILRTNRLTLSGKVKLFDEKR